MSNDLSAAEPPDPGGSALGALHFSSPEQILESRVHSTAEKRRILLQALEDEMALLAADDDGMRGSRPSRITQVRGALRALQA